MSTAVPGGAIPRVRTLVYALIATIAATAILIPAQSAAKRQGEPVTVMSRNVYLGADLGPALNADSIPEAIDGAGEIFNEIEATNFRERVVPLAREIQRTEPALVGLQEVAHWRVQHPSDGGAPPISPVPGAELATRTKYNFLGLLRRELGDRYRVIGIQNEFEGELPADIDGDDATGNGPLADFGADLDLRLTMRDVILKRKGSGVKATKRTVEMDHFDNAFTADIGGVEVTADRGWLSVEAAVRPGKRGVRAGAAKAGDRRPRPIRFRFVNTHLEAFGDPRIREAQAKELFAPGGPLRTNKRVILVGDLNSGIGKHNIGAGGGGSANPDDQLAFRALKGFGMRDYGAVQSCCYPDMFDGSLEFTHTVDHVLANRRANIKRFRARVTGNNRLGRTPSGLWPSDHGGVVSKLELRR